MAQLKFGEMNK